VHLSSGFLRMSQSINSMDTLYPQYPDNRGISRSAPYDLGELMRFYDDMVAVGLYVLPKISKRKYPVAEFWGKDKILSDRQEALSWQSKSFVNGWCVVTGAASGRVVVIDLDTAAIPGDAVARYTVIQEASPSAFVLKTPANGVHIYYRLPDDLPMPGNIKLPFTGVDFRGEGGQVVSLGGINHYTGSKALDKGVSDGHRAAYERLPFGVYDHIPLMSDELYKMLMVPVVQTVVEKGESYAQTEQGQKRVEVHLARSDDEKVVLTRELLRYALTNWDDTKSITAPVAVQKYVM